MFLIGENLNVMSKKLGEAFLKRDAGPIQDMARAQAEAGMDMIDLNIGPARKTGPDFMEWLVNIVQEVTDLPLSLDTSNAEAIEAGLKAARDAAAHQFYLRTAREDRGAYAHGKKIQCSFHRADIERGRDPARCQRARAVRCRDPGRRSRATAYRRKTYGSTRSYFP